MRTTKSTWLDLAIGCLLGVFLLAVAPGCRQGEPEKEPGPAVSNGENPQPAEGESDEGDSNGGATTEPPTPEPPTPEPPPKPTMPEPQLTDAQRATLVVDVGDAMPEAELPDLEGQPQSLAALRGEKLTVVVFWNLGETVMDEARATGLLEDMQFDVVDEHGEKGVKVVAIDVSDPAEKVSALVEDAGATFPVLLDAEGKYFAQIATEKLPRLYLLDAEGKILWFDLEYSETTRDDLQLAIRITLGEE